MKSGITSLFLIIVFFFEPIFYCTTTVFGIEPTFMGQSVAVMTVLSGLFFMLNRPPASSKVLLCLCGLVVFGFVFYSTSMVYGYEEKYYMTHFQTWLSLGNSSVIVGMMLNNVKSQQFFSKFVKYMPVAIIGLTLIISSRILLGQDTENGQFNDEFGLSYQTMAYYLAVLFACSAFYVFVYPRQIDTTVKLRMPLLLLMPVQLVMCAMSGGRGGFLLIMVYIAYYLWFLVNNKVISIGKLSFVLIIAAIAVVVLASELGLAESAGFQRSADYNRDSRTALWFTYIPIIEESPIFGHGLGSVFYTWGFYSHNLIVDFLVEGGLIGALFMIFVYSKIFSNLKKSSIGDPIAFFVLLFFIYQFVLNFFSLYWPSGQYNWLALGYVLTYRKTLQVRS